MAFKSGGGVLLIAAAQLLIGLALLGVYEGKSKGHETFLHLQSKYMYH